MAKQDGNPVVIVALLSAVSLGAGVAFFLLVGGSSEFEPAPSVAAEAPAQMIERPGATPGSAPDDRSGPAEAADPAQAAQHHRQPRNRMARDLERERIWSALRREHGLEPAAPGAAAPDPSAAAQLPSLDPEYIKSAIAEQLLPIAIECYESALEDDPALAGSIVANFTIVGAEEIGGIVEDATVTDESTLDSAFVRECMRESLMAVSFEPPTDGGRVEVTYPFMFAPEEPSDTH